MRRDVVDVSRDDGEGIPLADIPTHQLGEFTQGRQWAFHPIARVPRREETTHIEIGDASDG